MATKDNGAGRRGSKDLRGIRQRGSTYQVRVFGGPDPVTGKPVMLTGTAADEAAAIRMRDRFRAEVSADKAARTRATVAYLIREWLHTRASDHDMVYDYRLLVEKFVIPALGDIPLTRLARIGPRAFDQLYGELRRCRRRCDGRPFVEHHKGCAPDIDGVRSCDGRCRPHMCKPISESTLRHIHTVCNGAFKAAVRWGWLGVNPLSATERPRAPRPEPRPPSPSDAALIIDTAMSTDEDWGTFVWLAMVSGARRGELVALRFTDVQLRCAECDHALHWDDGICTNSACGRKVTTESRTGTLDIRKGYVRRAGRDRETDTKTHQMRRIALDPTTTDILARHRARYVERVTALEGTPQDTAYIFSYDPEHRRPCSPDGLTHRYSRMTADLGLDTHLHELRHYSATELLAAGVDLRTVAGRLGHAGGGATTLRVYAAWRRSADEDAAAVLAARLTGRLRKQQD